MIKCEKWLEILKFNIISYKMSEIYGYSSSVSRGNTADETLMGIRRQIDAQNSLARDNFNSLRTNDFENKQVAQQNLSETKLEDRADEGKDGGSILTAVDDLTSKRMGVDLVGSAKKSLSSIGSDVAPQSDSVASILKSVRQSGGGEFNSGPSILSRVRGVFGKMPATDLDLGKRVVLPSESANPLDSVPTLGRGLEEMGILSTAGGGGQITRNLGRGEADWAGNPVARQQGLLNRARQRLAFLDEGPAEGGAREPFVSQTLERSEQVANVPRSLLSSSPAGATRRATSVISGISTETPKVEESITKGSSLLGSSVKGALRGATILTGGYDLIKDIAGPKGSFNNLGGKGVSADKVSNIAGIVSGGLETAGVGIAATGIGLPVAGAVEVAGAVVGAIGLGASLVGDITDEKKQSAQVKALPTIGKNAVAPQQSEPAYKSSSQSGQLVQ